MSTVVLQPPSIISTTNIPEKKAISYKNLLLGAGNNLPIMLYFYLFFKGLHLFETSTLGQPFEVLKTQMAANRGQPITKCLQAIYSHGGIVGFYQGLIPWAWIEASTKGAVLLFTASELEHRSLVAGASSFTVEFNYKKFLSCLLIPTHRLALLEGWVGVLLKPTAQWVSVHL